MKIRKTQVLAVAFFLGFFVFINYLLGFTSIYDAGGLGTGRPVHPVEWTPQYGGKTPSQIREQIREELKAKNKESLKSNKPPQVDVNAGEDATNAAILPLDPTPPIAPPSPVIPVVQDTQENVWLRYYGPSDPSISCKHTRERNYDTDPIVVDGRFSGRADCDVPCQGGGNVADVTTRQSSDPHVKTYFFTMENIEPGRDRNDIVANTRLDSDVPLPYFNWVEYNFRREPMAKTAPALVAAFISNCGPAKRLSWMASMRAAGVSIDSYGKCDHTKSIPADVSARFGGDYNAAKTHVVSQYKFTMSFENSATNDYVTEKLFGVLVAGSVPLYDGAPNGKLFAPDDHSVIYAADFNGPEEMAKYLLYLDSNDTAYNEYLEWKYKGPSDRFVALMDIGNVHSNCRMCIRGADMHRKEVGPVDAQTRITGEPAPSSPSIPVFVRERGKFWLYPIYLVERTVAELHRKILEHLPAAASRTPETYVYSVHSVWTNGRQTFDTDAAVASLEGGEELQAVLVTPQRPGQNTPWYTTPPPPV